MLLQKSAKPHISAKKEKFESKYLGCFVEPAKQLVQRLDQLVDRQSDCQLCEFHNVRIQNAYVFVFLHVELAEIAFEINYYNNAN